MIKAKKCVGSQSSLLKAASIYRHMVEYITHSYYGESSYNGEYGDSEVSFHKWLNGHCKHGWELVQIIPMKRYYSYEKPSWGEGMSMIFLCVFKKVQQE